MTGETKMLTVQPEVSIRVQEIQITILKCTTIPEGFKVPQL
jgi:hypothetical protein